MWSEGRLSALCPMSRRKLFLLKQNSIADRARQSPDLPPSYTEATLLSPDKEKVDVASTPPTQTVSAGINPYQEELGCIIWPRSSHANRSVAELRGGVVEGISADILDLAWSSFELCPSPENLVSITPTPGQCEHS